jgi:hypothetical protein
MKPEDKAVVRQALEALEYHTVQTRPLTRTQEAMDALRQLLEQPVQEPVEMREVLVKIARFLNVVQVYAQDIPPKNEIETDKPLHWKARELQDEVIRLLDTTPPAQPAVPKQCWKCGDMDAMGHAKCDVPACGMKEQPNDHCEDVLHMVPAAWVGLTDEEITLTMMRVEEQGSGYFLRLARAIEAKLREKNAAPEKSQP